MMICNEVNSTVVRLGLDTDPSREHYESRMSKLLLLLLREV